MNLAIFDMDGTITRYSSERLFIKYLLKNKKISYMHLVSTLILFILKHPIQASTGLKQNKMYLKGIDEQKLRTIARECFEKEIQRDIKTAISNEIRQLKSMGYKILLLSGSLPCLVEPMAQHVQADFTLCSSLEQSNGRFTGELASIHPYAKNKKFLTEAFCKEHNFDVDKSLGYANEWADRFFLETVREAIAVDPDQKLRKMALQKNWKIIEDHCANT